MTKRANNVSGSSFSLRIKDEVTGHNPKDINRRQAVIAGVFCCQSAGDTGKPALEVRLPGKAGDYVSRLLSSEGIPHRKDGDDRIIVEDPAADEFLSLYGAFFAPGATGILAAARGFERYFLQGAFLSCGYFSDPYKSYRVEFHLKNKKAAETVEAMLRSEGFNPLSTVRKSVNVIYLKNGDAVSDLLAVIGADSCKLAFESIRTEKEVMGSVTRTVNCDSANTRRQAEAGAVRNELIKKLMNSDKAATLPGELLEAARVHMENPGLSIADLGKMMDPPLGKSGMNHRLARLLEIAKALD
ncbi:MAG: DNA-binding protein WhiA [Clostridiales bacterium]|nr:DNA-binding protein WhiA [Clostridiales bacterium]